jgi:photosystem II stability/assembly factor-like uncharacterized protein
MYRAADLSTSTGALPATERRLPTVYGSMRNWAARKAGAAVAYATVLAFLAPGCGDGDGGSAVPSVMAVGAIADAGIAIRSDDLGQSWSTVLQLTANSFAAVDFVDRDHGWIVARSAIQHTSDGGVTWHRQEQGVPTGSDAPGLLDVAFADPQHGIAVGVTPSDPGVRTFTASVALHTKDGGQAWTAAPSAVHATNAAFSGTCVTPDGVAFAVGDSGFNSVSNAAIASRSADFGATWETVFIFPDVGKLNGSLRDVACVAADDLWIAGQDVCRPFCGENHGPEELMLLRSRDGGRTWNDESSPARLAVSPVAAVLAAIAFSDRDRGWAVGSSADPDGAHHPLILHTADGGRRWLRQSVIGTDEGTLTAVSFADTEHGMIVGHTSDDRAFVLATANGGIRWHVVSLPKGVLSVADVAFVPTD